MRANIKKYVKITLSSIVGLGVLVSIGMTSLIYYHNMKLPQEIKDYYTDRANAYLKLAIASTECLASAKLQRTMTTNTCKKMINLIEKSDNSNGYTILSLQVLILNLKYGINVKVKENPTSLELYGVIDFSDVWNVDINRDVIISNFNRLKLYE